MSAQLSSLFDNFPSVVDAFSAVLTWAQDLAASPASLHDVEAGLSERAPEVLRCVVQRVLDLMAQAEKAKLGSATPKPRSLPRLVESRHGEVYLYRLSVPRPDGKGYFFPLDAVLNLPPERYSLDVREQVAHGAAQQPLAPVLVALDKQGVHVPKRQALQQVAAAAQDVEAFYAQQPVAANDMDATTWVLGSHDSCGTQVLPEALRPATRKKAEQRAEQAQKGIKGDPMAAPAAHPSTHRMTAVGVVWEQVPQVRTANDIVLPLGQKRPEDQPVTKLPKPQNKEVHASLKKNVRASVGDTLETMQRRDPDNQHKKAMLVDGEDKQLVAIQAEAKKLGMTLLVILDLIHVLHYVWMAAHGLFPKTKGNAQVWVQKVLRKLLTEPPATVLAFLRAEMRKRSLSTKGRRNLKKCLTYLTKRKAHIHYAEYLALGLPIATGVVEGTCRTLVKDRMGVTGARWGLEGGEAVLLLRAVLQNQDWDEYMAFHRQQEFQRNHVKKLAALPCVRGTSPSAHPPLR
jgi:hypothetical protein